MARHIKLHQNKIFNCNKCNKKFKSEQLLEKHKNFHKLKTCQLCENEFRRPSLLKKHLKICQSKKETKVCSECGLKFGRPWRLVQHLREAHEKIVESPVRSFNCRFCDIITLSDKELKSHNKIHHADKG